MLENEELFDKYDLLLPSKFNGGFLVISLYQKIKSKIIARHFTSADIKYILEEIAIRYCEPVAQSEKVIKNLIHFFIRGVPGEPGKYYLTDHAESLVELMVHKLDNPYKNFPLKKNFQKYFTVRYNEIKHIDDLERRFGREFVSGHKRIINDHLETLEDELEESYGKLGDILNSEAYSATEMVKEFALVFRSFGERAEDIANAIASKDKFLRSLREEVDKFYQKVAEFKNPETAPEREQLEQYKSYWLRATVIYQDIEGFFDTVDYKIGNIRRQIHRASEKLSELHENFSSRSHFRIQVKRLYRLALEGSAYKEEDAPFDNGFPVKGLVFEKTRLIYPEYYDYGIKRSNIIVEPEVDEAYLSAEKEAIEFEIKQQEIINFWVGEGKRMLENNQELVLGDLMELILSKENDLTVAYHAAIELTQFASEGQEHILTILNEAYKVRHTDFVTWKMSLRKLRTFVS